MHEAVDSARRYSILPEAPRMTHPTQKDAARSLEVVSPRDDRASMPISTITGDRVVFDSERFFSSVEEEHIDPADSFAPEWSRMRQTIAVFPFPRGERGPLAEALLRDEVEYSAETIAARSGCRWIVDKRIVSLFEIDVDSSDASAKATIETGCPATSSGTPAKSWSRGLLRRLTGNAPRVATDRIELEAGVLTTPGGGRRVNSRCITSIFHEAGSTDRLDVRIISDRRTVRLRFDSRNDPRFQAFWSRWRAEPSEDRSSRSST